MIFAYDHDIPAFEGNFFVVPFAGEEEMVMGIGQLENMSLVFVEEGMVEEDIFGQEGFAGAGFFGRLVEEYVFIDDDADVACEDEIGNGCEKHLFIVHGAADECLGEFDGRELLEALLGLIADGLDGADGGNEF